jgi:hypothetical protein
MIIIIVMWFPERQQAICRINRRTVKELKGDTTTSVERISE